MSEIDWSKPVETQDGRDVTILSTDGRGSFPVVGYIQLSQDLRTWSTGGGYTHQPCDIDLINVPEPPAPVYWSKPSDFPAVCWLCRSTGADNLTSFNVVRVGRETFTVIGVDRVNAYPLEEIVECRWSPRPGVPWEEMKECVVGSWEVGE